MKIKPNVEINSASIDHLPNDPQQMISWRCNQVDKAIAVEIKDVDNWQKMLDSQSSR